MSELVKQRVNKAWDQIESKVAELDPKQLKLLRPPATKKEVDDLSKAIGIKLPSDIVASLMRHNGCKPKEAFLRYHYYPADKIAEATIKQREWYETHADENNGRKDPLDKGGWNSEAIMFGTTFAGYEHVVICENCEMGVPYFYAPVNYSLQVALNYVSYLETMAKQLQEGVYEWQEGTLVMSVGY